MNNNYYNVVLISVNLKVFGFSPFFWIIDPPIKIFKLFYFRLILLKKVLFQYVCSVTHKIIIVFKFLVFIKTIFKIFKN